jgi:hypothetical protein
MPASARRDVVAFVVALAAAIRCKSLQPVQHHWKHRDLQPSP